MAKWVVDLFCMILQELVTCFCMGQATHGTEGGKVEIAEGLAIVFAFGLGVEFFKGSEETKGGGCD